MGDSGHIMEEALKSTEAENETDRRRVPEKGFGYAAVQSKTCVFTSERDIEVTIYLSTSSWTLLTPC